MKTLFTNATFYSLENETENWAHVLVENGKIIDVSNNPIDIEVDQTIDLKGGYVFPGFVDSHIHFIGHGDKIRYLDLSTYTNWDDIKTAVQDYAKTFGNDEWIVGEGWNENQMEDGQIISLHELDTFVDQPLMLKRICRHALLANSKAMELSNVTAKTVEPTGGKIGLTDDGDLNGLFFDTAMDLITTHIPEVSIDQLAKSVQAAYDDLTKKGFTGVHTEDMSYYGHYSKPLKAIQQTINENQKFRVHLLRHHAVFEEMMDAQIKDTPFVEGGAMKIFSDGALGGRTAYLIEPYEDEPETRGIAIHSQKNLNKLVQVARTHDEAIAVHAIGDGAMELVLTAIEAHPCPNGKRDRIIHANVVNEELVTRLQKLGDSVVLDIQPMFVPSDFPWVIDRLGERRLKWAYAWKTLLEKGIHCSGGSDSPIEDADLLLGLYAAVERKLPSDEGQGYLPHEKLSMFEAIQLYTQGSAFVIGKENNRGKIKVGYDADFTVFDQDLLHVQADELMNTKVLYTIVDGTIVYQ